MEQYTGFHENLVAVIAFIKSEYHVTRITASLMDSIRGGQKIRSAKAIMNVVFTNTSREAGDEYKRQGT